MVFDCFNIKLQNMRLKVFLAAISLGFISFSCSDKDDVSAEPQLIIKFKFDPTQVRLNNLGFDLTLFVIDDNKIILTGILPSIRKKDLQLFQK